METVAQIGMSGAMAFEVLAPFAEAGSSTMI